MANQGEAEQMMGRADAYVGDCRESGEVPMAPTFRVPRIVAPAMGRMTSDPSGRDTLPDAALPEDAEGQIELPASRRVTQRPPHEQDDAGDGDDEEGIIGLPIDVLRIESDQEQDADEEILGLPSLLPGADEDAGEMVGRPTESTFPEIPPPAPLEPWEKRPADEFDLDDVDLDDTIIYPSEG